MAPLGCITEHTVYIQDRGGFSRGTEIRDISALRYSRERDAMSEARLVISGDSCSAQADVLSTVEPHRTEIVIYRGRDRVWEGPVRLVTSAPDYMEIVANDIFLYILHAPLSIEWNNAYPNNTEVTTRIQEILEYELVHTFKMPDPDGGPDLDVVPFELLDPPINVLPYLDVRHFPNEAGTSAVTLPFQMTIGEHIKGLARQSGIDWTVIGRRFVCWDTSRNLGRLQPMTDNDFGGGVIVTSYGSDHTQFAVVSTGEGPVGRAGKTSDYYGPWLKVFTVYNEDGTSLPSIAELNSQAQRNTTGRSPVPIEVRVPDNSTIYLSESLTIQDLVPGVQVEIRSTLGARKLAQLQKLDRVQVSESGKGEMIQITLTPATRVDSDEEEV